MYYEYYNIYNCVCVCRCAPLPLPVSPSVAAIPSTPPLPFLPFASPRSHFIRLFVSFSSPVVQSALTESAKKKKQKNKKRCEGAVATKRTSEKTYSRSDYSQSDQFITFYNIACSLVFDFCFSYRDRFFDLVSAAARTR
ncbi:hypothetical protein PUN28_004726 [Cardiocondyla obscurior]|uniref:Uncharacterized protein n=1 Tax=Cardiocondyla obscurior TaxID=286306 RepID=A0AAW2GE81_9HYME